jgi:hypothetical protein
MAIYQWTTGAALTEVLTRENIQDLIVNMFPYDTELDQMLGEQSFGNSPSLQTPMDTSSDITRTSGALTANVKAESSLGIETTTLASASLTSFQTKLKAVAEIHQESYSVSGTDRRLNTYGFDDRFVYEGMKKAKKVNNDIQLAYYWGPGTADTVASRQTQGLASWALKSGLERTISGSASFTDPHGVTITSPYYGYAYNAAGTNLDLSMFNQVLDDAYSTTGFIANGGVLLTSAQLKTMIGRFGLSSLGPVNQRNIGAGEQALNTNIEVITTNHGTMRIRQSRYLSIPGQATSYTLSAGGPVVVPWNELVLMIMPEKFRRGIYRPMEWEMLAKVGDFDSAMITCEAGMICYHPQGAVAISNCIAP